MEDIIVALIGAAATIASAVLPTVIRYFLIKKRNKDQKSAMARNR